MLKIRNIDHLVYAVPNLEQAMIDFENLTGVAPIFGGHHLTKGTKNALVHLGNKAYLEFLSIDHNNVEISAPRWMGVDLISEAKITRWALNSSKLIQDSEVVRNFQSEMGQIQGGQRKTSSGQLLKWKMIMPLAAPAVELVPFMCDWQHSAIHPTDALPKQCELLKLDFTHPNPASLKQVMNNLSLNIDIMAAKDISIKATIQTPKGIFYF